MKISIKVKEKSCCVCECIRCVFLLLLLLLLSLLLLCCLLPVVLLLLFAGSDNMCAHSKTPQQILSTTVIATIHDTPDLDKLKKFLKVFSTEMATTTTTTTNGNDNKTMK